MRKRLEEEDWKKNSEVRMKKKLEILSA